MGGAETHDAGTQGDLHIQQDIETPPRESPPQIAQGSETPALVIDNELDPLDIPQEGGLQLADDPGDPGSGPVFLDRSDHWHHVGAIPDS